MKNGYKNYETVRWDLIYADIKLFCIWKFEEPVKFYRKRILAQNSPVHHSMTRMRYGFWEISRRAMGLYRYRDLQIERSFYLRSGLW
jgi:hypothetical protein